MPISPIPWNLPRAPIWPWLASARRSQVRSCLQAGILTEAELAELHGLGAVGDIALRFFDGEGRAVEHPINDRIIGLDLNQIKRIPRVIGVAGGKGKYEVIRGAVRRSS